MFNSIKGEIQGFYQQTLTARQRAELEAAALRRKAEKNRILQRIQDGNVEGRLKERIADPCSVIWAPRYPAAIPLILASNNDRDLLFEIVGILGEDVEDEWVEFSILSSKDVEFITRLKDTDSPHDYEYSLVATFKLA